jgi:spore maturation protein CgeB
MSSEHLRVLFVSLRWDYGDQARGSSFEYENLWDALWRMDGIEARFFGFDEEAKSLGLDAMNAELLRVAEEWKPDLVFFFLFKNEIQPDTVRRLGLLPGVTTLNWFADDHWRFNDFSRHWAPRFDWIVTTDARALPRYRAIGVETAIHSQWGVNHHAYRRPDKRRDIDVSFIGQPYGHRREFVERLRSSGILVETCGHGWERGRVDQAEMVDILSRSKISLNFAASSPRYSWQFMAAQFLRRVGPVPVPRFRDLLANAKALRDAYHPQLKARNFEIAATGALLLTEHVDQLAAYYRPGVEAVPFRGARDLLAKVTRYLADDEARERIAQAGQARTLSEHTYSQRLETIFKRIDPDPRG